MTNKIYFYNHNTSVNIPEKIDDKFPISILTGDSINKVLNQISDKAAIFCVYTNSIKYDFVVPSETEAAIVEKMLKTVGYDTESIQINVAAKSMWYSPKAKKNIIISGAIPFDNKLESFFLLYLDLLNKSLEEDNKIRVRTVKYVNSNSMFYIMNTRNKKILMKTPNIEDAKRVCNENPCCVVKNNKGEVVHRSMFSRVTVPNNKPKMINNVMRKQPSISSLTNNLIKINLK